MQCPSPDLPNPGIEPGSPALHADSLLYEPQQGSPGILEWVAYPFSRELSDLGIETGSPALQADSLPAELPGKPPAYIILNVKTMNIFSLVLGAKTKICALTISIQHPTGCTMLGTF